MTRTNRPATGRDEGRRHQTRRPETTSRERNRTVTYASTTSRTTGTIAGAQGRTSRPTRTSGRNTPPRNGTALAFLVAATFAAAALPAGAVRAHPAAASASAFSTSGFHADFEVDPTAYVLEGHSLHVGLGWKKLRLDLGAFALALPAALTGHDDFSVAFDGYGAKLQYFPFAEQRGAFVGIDAGVARPFVRRKGTDLATRRTEYNAGINFGWRFVFLERFYATAWLGLSRPLGREPVTLAGSTYEGSALTVFPAVHLGYRFF
jgi:hypothetical protein